MILSSAVFGGESPNDRIDTLLSLMTGVSERVDKLVKNVAKIETVVEKSVGWKFLGMGDTVKYDDSYSPGDGLTLAGCIGGCTDKHSSDSNWNGVHFDPSDGYCWCYKNDVGHNPLYFKDMLHFKFE